MATRSHRVVPSQAAPRVADSRRTAPPTSGRRTSSKTPASPPARSSYVEALAAYAEGLSGLQRRDFRAAADRFRHILASFGVEREVVERARLYLAVCERQLAPPEAPPRTPAERLYAATLALNAGRLDDALVHLERVAADDPGNDRALYLLAVAHTQRDAPELAIRYLEQAIAANAENRSLARVDPDLAPLRARADVGPLLRRRLVPSADSDGSDAR
ncbi:MAG: tetratricopeptide repeat protein [Acidobacteriota bacterium]